MSEPGFFFEPVFENAGEPVFVIDPLEDRFVAANPAGCRLLGYSRQELLETPVSRIHPGELEQLQAVVGAVLHRGHGSTIGLSCLVRQGTRVPIELTLSTLDDDGRTLVLALVRDRSEHRGRSARD